jgi:hypothetical protein
MSHFEAQLSIDIPVIPGGHDQGVNAAPGGASDSAFAISPSVAAAIGWPARAALTLAGLLARSRPDHPRRTISCRNRPAWTTTRLSFSCTAATSNVNRG